MTDKQKIAYTLYMQGGRTLEEVAELVGVTPRMTKQWSTDGNWAKLRASNAITPQKLLDNLYMMVHQAIEQVNKRPSKVATTEEAKAIANLADAIKKMQSDVGVVEICGVGTRFINWLKQVDLDKAKEVSGYFDGFIKDSVKI